jgi:NADPH-dependent 2,4-dienoyl-CoA reductase/sulfur reductase-like enzyme
MVSVKTNADVAVIGGGPAGLAAAIKAKESGADTVVIFERDNALGGILQQCVHTGFGLQLFATDHAGTEYAERFIKAAERVGVETRMETTVLTINSGLRVQAVNPVDGLFEVTAQAVILAMGCRERTRGSLRIPGTRPAGVITAGTAQRYVNLQGYLPGSRVVVLGSGDVGLIMARRFTLEGAKVEAVVETQPFPGGLTRNVVQCLDDFGIPLLLRHTVVEIHGSRRVTGVTVMRLGDDAAPVLGSEQFIPCDTVLFSVGLIPENELSRALGLVIDPGTGGPVIDETYATSIAGVFSCGNVLHVNDTVDNVTVEGYTAGNYAAQHALDASPERKGRETLLKAGRNIRYMVPQRLRRPNVETVRLSLRVKKPEDAVSLRLSAEDVVIFQRFYPVVRPGELLTMTLPEGVLRQMRERAVVEGSVVSR